MFNLHIVINFQQNGVVRLSKQMLHAKITANYKVGANTNNVLKEIKCP